MSTASSSNVETAMMRKAMKLLHSTQPGSATELRLMLDDVIQQRYGSEKMLRHTLSKHHLEEESDFPGMVVPAPTPTDEVINLINSPAKTISDSPDTIIDSDDAMSVCGDGDPSTTVASVGSQLMQAGDDDGNLKEFGDLNCCICGEMMFTASNRLIECKKCCMLYHQECHKPPITDKEASEEEEHNWRCNACDKPSSVTSADKVSTESAVVVIADESPPAATVAVAKAKSSGTSSRSSSSSNSSSPFYKHDQAAASSTSPASGKHHHHKRSSVSSSKSHSSSKEERAASVVTPVINVISAVEKSSSHSSSTSSSSSSSKKQSSHTPSSKSSSSKSSKHHDSSSSKRRSK